jgi:hypothetical protein
VSSPQTKVASGLGPSILLLRPQVSHSLSRCDEFRLREEDESQVIESHHQHLLATSRKDRPDLHPPEQKRLIVRRSSRPRHLHRQLE